MAVFDILTGGQPENLGFVELPVIVVFNPFNGGTGLSKTGIPDKAQQFIGLPTVPLRIHQKPQPVFKAKLAVVLSVKLKAPPSGILF